MSSRSNWPSWNNNWNRAPRVANNTACGDVGQDSGGDEAPAVVSALQILEGIAEQLLVTDTAQGAVIRAPRRPSRSDRRHRYRNWSRLAKSCSTASWTKNHCDRSNLPPGSVLPAHSAGSRPHCTRPVPLAPHRADFSWRTPQYSQTGRLLPWSISACSRARALRVAGTAGNQQDRAGRRRVARHCRAAVRQ